MSGGERGRAGRLRRSLVWVVGVLLAVSLAWWLVGRVAVGSEAVRVERWVERPAPGLPTDSTLRVLAWNIAHGRGDVGPGLLRNWRGGGPEARTGRLIRIAEVLERVGADVVVLNEVDFRSSWSGGVDQAELLARAAGYPVAVVQRNYDVRLPLATFSFGNAVLTRLPVRGARRVELPAHSRLEALAAGAKTGAVVRLETGVGVVSVVPIHLEPRSGRTRRAAVPVLEELRGRTAEPLILAGDFNAAPSGWPGTDGRTVLDDLLEEGWQSPRARGRPSPDEWTHPTYALRRSLDWVLVEPPLEILRTRVVRGAAGLSDHAPVLAVVGRLQK